MSEAAQRAEPGTAHAILVGDCPGLGGIRGALAHHDEIELLEAASAREAAGPLSRWDVDVVLLATVGPSLPADELAELREHTKSPVIVLAPAAAAEVLEQALRADVADALLVPQPSEAVLFAIRKVTGRREAPQHAGGRIVTVFSPKGGTGKTVTSTNLAVALARDHEQRVLLVDLDLQFGDCAIVLGLDPPKTVYDLVSAAGELDPDKLAGYTVRHESGIDLLAAPQRPEEAEFVPVAKIVRLLDVARETYDVTVIDTAPFLHGPILAAIDHADELLLLAALDVPTLKDVRQSLETLSLISFPAERVSLVLNRADQNAGLSRAEVEDALGLRFRFALPGDTAVPVGVNRGNPVVLSDGRSAFAHAVRAMAAALMAAGRPAPALHAVRS